MRKFVVCSSLLPALFLFAASAQADAVLVGSATADKLGNGAFDLLVDPTADETMVGEQLKANLQMSDGATVNEPVAVEKGTAHITFHGATPGSTVEANLPNEVADATGVGASPATEKRRRGFYWLAGGAATGGIICAIIGCFGSENGPPPAAPLEEVPPAPPAPAARISPSI